MVRIMPLDLPGMTGTMDVKVRDASGAETQFIQVGQSFTIELDWTINGAAVALGDPANQWHVRGRLESVGPPAFERQLAQEFVTNFVPTPGHAYTASITPTGAADQPGEGVYELAVLLDLRRPNGTRLPARGFQDGIQLDFFS
jgi:hypothetical protein